MPEEVSTETPLDREVSRQGCPSTEDHAKGPKKANIGAKYLEERIKDTL